MNFRALYHQERLWFVDKSETTAVEVSRKPFSLDKGPLISREIFCYYTANVNGITPSLPQLDLHCIDFSQWRGETGYWDCRDMEYVGISIEKLEDKKILH